MAADVHGAPFEGPEKLLEIWFAPTSADVPGAHGAHDGKFGLRAVPRAVWEEMLDIVKCKVLSVVQGIEMDAYLLSESSFFVSPHRLILKTCGTTLNLLGLPRILQIAAKQANLPTVHRLFYSRKSFMFPERQQGPHRGWGEEVKYLDAIFPNGSAYTVGRMNGDHWLLYMVGPAAPQGSPPLPLRALPARAPPPISAGAHAGAANSGDCTIEILMTHLSPEARAPFFFSESTAAAAPAATAQALSTQLGIAGLFPTHATTLDAYAFDPCGYSANALLRWGAADQAAYKPPTFDGLGGEGYYTIHVTPEEGWSYASFECNVPLPARHARPGASPTDRKLRDSDFPDLQTLVRRVVDIFQPGTLTLTLFVSSADNANAEEGEGESAVEAAQRAFKAALTVDKWVKVPSTPETSTPEPQSPSILSRVWSALGLSSADEPAPPASPVDREDADKLKPDTASELASGSPWGRVYKRTDKINYEFGGYDLAFASFELR